MPAPLPAATLRRLEKAARAAALLSYSPYSKFPVGAAILAGSGKVYTGSNVENASYGLGNCAERTAIFTAAAAGERQLRAVVVYTPTPTATAPAGLPAGDQRIRTRRGVRRHLRFHLPT